jgi:pSer/pThr/pTyr-binding forkhead associated (FHA) protein
MRVCNAIEESVMTTPNARLVMLAGPNTGREYELGKDITLIGRDEGCDILIADVEISRQHARITRTPRGYVLEDLGSTNGTYLDGQRVTAPHLLQPGDRISLSETVILSYEEQVEELGATVVSPARRGEAETAPIPAEEEPTRERFGFDETAGERRSRLPEVGPWTYAGCGCLVILGIVGVVLWVMPASWWCLLLSPLELIGIYFAGC